MFKGSITALITPFKGGKVDENAYEAIIEHQIAAGTSGLVPVGTTGESPTLSHDEHKRVVEICIKIAAGRVFVIAGTGSNNTDEAIDFTKHAHSAGANAALVVTPYYNKPNQRGLYAHFKAIAECADIPIVIYNIPGRCVIDMSPETMAELFKIPNIVGVKDATGDLARVSAQRAAMGPEFIQLSGEDATAVAFNANGGVGCIGVTANIAPKLCAEMQDACTIGNFTKALEIQDRLMPLHGAIFCDSNPVPVKYAANRLGLCEPDIRLPLVELNDECKMKVDQALKGLDLI